jgi:hypothetical protein
MNASIQQPLLDQPPDRRNWIPMAIGVAVVLAVLGAVALFSGRPSSQTNTNDPYLPKMQVSGLHMAQAQNLAGASLTYIEGKITNNGDRKITAAREEVIFRNSLGEVAQKDVIAVNVLLRSIPYDDYGPLDQAPLAPGQSRDFRLTLEHVTEDWNGQMPQVRVVSVSY